MLPMQTAQVRNVGLGLALASAFAFGGSGVAAKPLIEAGLDPLHVVWLRVAGAALVMLPVAWRHRDLLRRRPALLAGFAVRRGRRAGVLLRRAVPYPRRGRPPHRVPRPGARPRLGPFCPAAPRDPGRSARRGPRRRRPRVRRGSLGRARLRRRRPRLALCAAFCQAGYFILADHGGDGTEPADPLGVIAYGLLIGAVVLASSHGPGAWTPRCRSAPPRWPAPACPAWALLAWIVADRDRPGLRHRHRLRTEALPAGGRSGGLPGGGRRHGARVGAARRAPVRTADRGRCPRPGRCLHRPVAQAHGTVRGPWPGRPPTPLARAGRPRAGRGAVVRGTGRAVECRACTRPYFRRPPPEAGGAALLKRTRLGLRPERNAAARTRNQARPRALQRPFPRLLQEKSRVEPLPSYCRARSR